MTLLNAIALILFLLSVISGMTAVVSLVFVQKTFKWAKVKKYRKIHAFCFYFLLATFLLYTMGTIGVHSLGVFVFWSIYLTGTLYYFYKLKNPRIKLSQTKEESSQ